MAPPKAKKTATAADAVNFFLRGKKPTTTQRVVITKKSLTSSTSPKTHKVSLQADLESLDPALDKNEKVSKVTSVDCLDQTNDDLDNDLHTESIDKIQSDDSLESQDDPKHLDNRDHLTKQKLFSEVTTPPSSSIGSPKKSNSGHEVKINSEVKFNSELKAKSNSEPEVKSNSINLADGIHREDISKEEQALRQFDLTSRYGPCLDLTRLERWERASELGLNPPQGVKDLLQVHKALNSPLFAGRV
ncbi:hypothetical protein BGZ46_007497 [Entomortierella lignicola]|nr:hypothetical protein BGZ46_007497 [Entomortierella lignicola]